MDKVNHFPTKIVASKEFKQKFIVSISIHGDVEIKGKTNLVLTRSHKEKAIENMSNSCFRW